MLARAIVYNNAGQAKTLSLVAPYGETVNGYIKDYASYLSWTGYRIGHSIYPHSATYDLGGTVASYTLNGAATPEACWWRNLYLSSGFYLRSASLVATNGRQASTNINDTKGIYMVPGFITIQLNDKVKLSNNDSQKFNGIWLYNQTLSYATL